MASLESNFGARRCVPLHPARAGSVLQEVVLVLLGHVELNRLATVGEFDGDVFLADTPVQKKIELPGGGVQPGVAPSGRSSETICHAEQGDRDPAFGHSEKGSHDKGDHDPALGHSVKVSHKRGDLDPALGHSVKGSHDTIDSTCTAVQQGSAPPGPKIAK